MAVKYADLKEKLEIKEFTKDELTAIDLMETRIDAVLTRNFDNYQISFDKSSIDFSGYGEGKELFAITKNSKSTRKELMFKELKKRYEEAGWEVTIMKDNGYSADSVVFTGKK